jgi:hypothetical protein
MTDCPLLRELDAWFSMALDVLSGDPGARRDALTMLGGALTAEHAAALTRDDLVEVDGYAFAYLSDGRGIPLTPAYLEVTGLTATDWPDEPRDPREVEDAVAAVDGALARISGAVREGGVDRLRALRMHAWLHELGPHFGVLARCYGSELTSLLASGGACPATRREQQEVAIDIPRQRGARHTAAVA